MRSARLAQIACCTITTRLIVFSIALHSPDVVEGQLGQTVLVVQDNNYQFRHKAKHKDVRLVTCITTVQIHSAQMF